MNRSQTLPSSPPGERAAPAITGRHVLFAVVGFFLLVTSVNGLMIYKALTTFGGVETPDAYRKGLAYNERIAAEEAQAGLGWHDELTYAAADRALTLALKDRDGRPVSGASVTATVGRSATDTFDQTVTMTESSAGLYRAPVSLAPGTWIVDATASRKASCRQGCRVRHPETAMAQALTAGTVPGATTPQVSAAARDHVTTTIDFAVEGMHCGACMTTIEGALSAIPGVEAARANLTARRVSAQLNPDRVAAQDLIGALDRAGYRAAEIVDARTARDAARADDLLRRLGVAGFAAANIMLLSVSVWAGLASDMERSAQSLFHWLSALIALPAIAYAAEPFYRSAASALRARRLNMDVPISLGITLATAMSLYQTGRGGDQVYFDAAITLTFFLLIGRYLDEEVRVKAQGAAENLLGLKALNATVIEADGTARTLPARQINPGMRVLVAAGERIPVDGTVLAGRSEIEESLITGETIPKLKAPGAMVYAGTVNTTGVLTVEATAADERTLVAEIARLMQAAEQSRGRYVRLADRAARLYAPAVHLLGLTTFVGWMLAGAGWETALTYAIAVLIITCPCALALAVPVVQVAATTRLFGKGIIVKAPDALERLAETDTVVFDKTGTLTLGEPRLVRRRELRRRNAGARRLARRREPPSLLARNRRGCTRARPDDCTIDRRPRDRRLGPRHRHRGG